MAAIHDYKGGVIIISHNREFAGAVCQEKWIMDKGYLRREGESVALHEEEADKKEELGDKVVIDALGNEIKVRWEVWWMTGVEITAYRSASPAIKANRPSD